MTREELNAKYPWLKGTELFQHANGGGWVEKPDRIASTAYVSGLVFGNAQVSGDALVFGNALVSGNAQVFGNALVSGNARVSGNAQVSSQTLYTFGPIGSREGYTSYAAESDTIMCGCFFGTMAEFENAVEKTHGQTAHGDNYRALIAMLKSLK